MKSELLLKRIGAGIALAATLLVTGCNSDGSATGGTVGSGKPYPFDTCIVSGEKLGSMGDPIIMVYNGQEVKFCCKSCKPDFEKEPEKYLSKLTAK